MPTEDRRKDSFRVWWDYEPLDRYLGWAFPRCGRRQSPPVLQELALWEQTGPKHREANANHVLFRVLIDQR